MKTCKICRVKFIPTYSTLQPTCSSPRCVISWSRKVEEKKWKRDVQVMKERQKSISQWRRELQQVFNKYVRERDRGKGCISCGSKLQGKYDAGHYYSVGSYPNLRFHEDNCHGQCVYCNQHQHGNLLEYKIGINKRLGKYRVEQLEEQRNETLRLPLNEIKISINQYKTKIKTLCTK